MSRKGKQDRPRVFIGSSSEGLRIAEALFACLSRETMPTLWTNQLFLPGQYPLESLETQIRRHSFAVLVASPDDEILKRGVSSPAMRDNLLLEFGLFAGALGRRRAFFVCPDGPKIDLPSDLFGVITATYDASRASGELDDVAAAVQVPCQQIRSIILEQWELLQEQAQQRTKDLLRSRRGQAISRLYKAGTLLRDVVLAVQRDALAAFSDEEAFEEVKQRAAAGVRDVAKSFREDAEDLEIEDTLEGLVGATAEALKDLPFPKELGIGTEEANREMVRAGLGALDTLLGGGDPVDHVRKVASDEIASRVSALRDRYSTWWDRHYASIQEAAAALQDALLRAAMGMALHEHFDSEGKD